MSESSSLEDALQRIVDAVFARWPARTPDKEKRLRCRLVAHRGIHDNTTVMENTLVAFEKAEAAGVWGIECDVRWTSDGTPVVSHDPDLQRLFGRRVDIDRITYPELQSRCPLIPSLETVVQRFGRRLHLMIEIKQTHEGHLRRMDRLQEVLATLRPIQDFHLMTLYPPVLKPFRYIPREAFLAITTRLPYQFSTWVRQNGWGGLCGHYLLMTPAHIRAHRKLGQQVGTGYAASRNVLFREINRGIDWIFSNQAAEMQRILNGAPAVHPPPSQE
jgi:glycerophosphoryl diester phosphodiesterase